MFFCYFNFTIAIKSINFKMKEKINLSFQGRAYGYQWLLTCSII